MNQTKIEWAPIDDIKPDDINPRGISESKMAELMESIKNFPKMMEYRPVIADRKTGRIIGGKQRHTACKGLGWKTIPVIYVSGLDERKMREMMLKDNMQFGEWDFSKLKEGYTQDQLLSWGLEDAKYVSFFDAFDEEKHVTDKAGDPETGLVMETETYDQNAIKKFIFNLSTEEYDSSIEKLTEFNERFGLEDNSQALLMLLKIHENEPGV